MRCSNDPDDDCEMDIDDDTYYDHEDDLIEHGERQEELKIERNNEKW